MIPLAILIAALPGDIQQASGGQTIRVEDVQVTLIAEVHAPAREAGVLAELLVKEGDLVDAGAELGKLDADLAAIDEQLARIEFSIAKLQSENDVDKRFARKSLEVAKSELARSLASVETFPKSISKTELDRLRLVVEKSRLSIEQSDRDLRVADFSKSLRQQQTKVAIKHLQQHRVTSPIDGMVIQLFRKPGEWLNQGDPVMRIIQLDRLRVEAFVDGQKYGADLLGCPARLTTRLPPGDREAPFDGRIVFVSPELQPVNGQLRVWAEVENHDLQLRPGARGTLSIDLSKPATSPSRSTQE